MVRSVTASVRRASTSPVMRLASSNSSRTRSPTVNRWRTERCCCASTDSAKQGRPAIVRTRTRRDHHIVGLLSNVLANHLRATCPWASTCSTYYDLTGAQTNASLATGTPVRCIGPSESAVVNGRMNSSTADAARSLRPTKSQQLPHAQARHEAGFTRLCGHGKVQEHPFEGGGPFGLPGGRLGYAADPSECTGRTSDRSCW